MARVLAESGGSFQQSPLDEFDEADDRYLRAFAQALPHLSTEELWWRLQTTALVIAFHRVVMFAGGRPSETRPEARLEPEEDFRGWMLAYVTAAMCAPGAGAAPRSQSANLASCK